MATIFIFRESKMKRSYKNDFKTIQCVLISGLGAAGSGSAGTVVATLCAVL